MGLSSRQQMEVFIHEVLPKTFLQSMNVLDRARDEVLHIHERLAWNHLFQTQYIQEYDTFLDQRNYKQKVR